MIGYRGDREGARAPRWVLGLAALLALAGCAFGCDIGAEIQFVRPHVAGAAALRMDRDAEGILGTLHAVLLDQEALPLMPPDRVVAGGQVLALDALSPEAVEIAGQIVGGPVPLALGPVTGLRYGERGGVCVIAIVIDNSAEAAVGDPEQARVTETRELVDRVLCRGREERPCPFTGCSVRLVVLQQDSAAAVGEPAADADRLGDLLATLPAQAGGSPALWDGLALAAATVRTAGGEAGGAVLLLWRSTQDGGSSASPAAAQARLGHVPLLAVTGGAPSEALAGVARRTGGFVIERSAAWPSELLVASAAVLGRWEVELVVPPAEDGDRRVTGELRLTANGGRWTSIFDLALSVR